MTPQFTVCCLCYGDYPGLIERLFSSLARPSWYPQFELRIVWQNLSKRSEASFGQQLEKFPVEAPLTLCRKGDPPYYKYPAMRKLFYEQPITTPYIMWFDDDSFIQPSAPDNWFDMVAAKLQDHDMVGAPYFKKLEGQQHRYIWNQVWYTGQSQGPGHRVNFITGGWWAIRTALIQKHGWPSSDIEHNGGDVMLGALCAEQGYKLGRFMEHVGINCNETCKCSSASRRGFSQKPIGYHGVTATVADIVPEVQDPDWKAILG